MTGIVVRKLVYMLGMTISVLLVVFVDQRQLIMPMVRGLECYGPHGQWSARGTVYYSIVYYSNPWKSIPIDLTFRTKPLGNAVLPFRYPRDGRRRFRIHRARRRAMMIWLTGKSGGGKGLKPLVQNKIALLIHMSQ